MIAASADEQSPAGYYCGGQGRPRKCGGGRYGAEMGLTSPACSGACEEGYLCDREAETSPFGTARCPNNTRVYCPAGVTAPPAWGSGSSCNCCCCC